MLGFMGPSGTFSQQAAKEWSQGTEELVEFPTIKSAIKAVDSGKIERCIVPIENSLNGSVTMTLDTLAFETDVYITDEFILDIEQNLVAKPGTKITDIKTIISHPQALGQCAKMLESDFSEAEQKAAQSTAKAAQCVSEGDGSIAALAPAVSAELYGLEVLRRDCSDDSNNRTRFVIIEKKPNFAISGHDKSSIVFSTEHKPGSLYKAIGLLCDEKINMLKIESRPTKHILGEYVFFIDIEGNADNAQIYFALDKVRRNASFYKFLGSYPYHKV